MAIYWDPCLKGTEDALSSSGKCESPRLVWIQKEISESAEHNKEREELVKKMSASITWTWRFKKPDNEQKTIICKLCRTPVVEVVSRKMSIS